MVKTETKHVNSIRQQCRLLYVNLRGFEGGSSSECSVLRSSTP